MHALDITQLQKTYDNGHEALKGIDLSVEEGDFFALLGPNGAGKSTAIGIICSLVNKTAGKVKVFDKDLDTDSGYAGRLLWRQAVCCDAEGREISEVTRAVG